MAQNISDNINVFEPGKDYLDRAVEGYEENVPLLAQIGAGFTPPGMAMDIAAAGKYGRDSFREFGQGNIGAGFGNLGISALSGLGAIPLVGDLVRGPKSILKGMLKGDADEVVDIARINKKLDSAGNVSKSPKERVDTAEELLNNAAAGNSYKGVNQTPRQPIEVIKNSDGTFNQLGGTSTLEALQKNGVTQIPIKIFDSKQAFETADFSRKQAKELKRTEDAVKMQPTIGNPTFEGPVRGFGNKTEKVFKKQFNKHQGDIVDGDQLFQRSLRLNPEFQTAISNIARDLDVPQGANPVGGKTLGNIDPDTGFPVGEVKLKPRTAEKVKDKYKGDFSQITDPIRTRIIVETPAQERLIADRIAKQFPVVDGERVIMKKSGYLDRKLNIQFTGSNGETLIGEVGIITRPMLDGAGEAHKYYEKYRKTNFGLRGKPSIGAIEKEGLRLEGIMKEIFERKGLEIDPDFYTDIIERFNKGGYVSSGRSGRLSPIVPNIFANSDFDNLEPSMKKSLTWPSVASIHPASSSNAGKYNPNLSSTPSTMTAGPFSQEKYNVSISNVSEPIVHISANNNNDIFVELDEEYL